jgi:Zn-dependent protease
VSDPPHWWPGDREGTSGPQGPGSPGGTAVPPGGNPSGSGAYYYPPGTTPGARGPNGPPPTRPRRSYSPRTWTWVAIAFGVGIILTTTHRISRDDVVLFCVIVPSIILHEIAHGWVALAFGDDTAKRAGRLTLNPIAHIDLLGTIIVPILMILGGYGWFGWAKPVPVNVSKLRSPRNHGVLVSLAGPAVNVVLCVISALLFHAFDGTHGLSEFPQPQLLALVLFYLGLVNLWLTAFNLIPIPPLDGSVLIERMLPASLWPGYLRLRRYTLPLVLVVVVFASIIPDGNTSLIGHLSNATINWWFTILGVPH